MPEQQWAPPSAVFVPDYTHTHANARANTHTKLGAEKSTAHRQTQRQHTPAQPPTVNATVGRRVHAASGALNGGVGRAHTGRAQLARTAKVTPPPPPALLVRRVLLSSEVGCAGPKATHQRGTGTKDT